MDGILILAHGSRRKETEETFEAIVAMVKAKASVPIEEAYMEFSERDIAQGVDALLGYGVTHIRVIPYFLFEGMHIVKDVPREIEEALVDKPGITFEIGKTLGADPRLADILLDHIGQ